MSGDYQQELGWLLLVQNTGSLSAAAAREHVSVSTISRRIERLEARLKLRLVDRHPGGARLSPAGERIAALAAPALDAMDGIARAALAMREGGEDKQVVTLSATEFVVASILAPALPALRDAAPSIQLALKTEAQLVSLAGRQADLAIRMSRPEGDSLLAKKLPALQLGLFATPSYRARFATDEALVREADVLTYDDSYGRLAELEAALQPLGGAVVLRTGSTQALVEAVRAGAGVAMLPAVFARRAGFVEVPLEPSIARTPWLLTHRDLRRVAPIRAVHRWVVATFADLAAEQRPRPLER